MLGQVADYLAVGMDPERCTIFAHTVGKDSSPMRPLTRIIARRFNDRYSRDQPYWMGMATGLVRAGRSPRPSATRCRDREWRHAAVHRVRPERSAGLPERPAEMGSAIVFQAQTRNGMCGRFRH